jgi:hypothetical protein
MALTITPEEIFMGVVTLSYGGTSIGGTTDPPKFGVDITEYTPSFQGAKGPIVGTTTITKAIPKVTFTVNQMTAEKLAWSMPGAVEAGGVITWEPGRVPSTAYKQLILEGQGLDGRLLRVTIENAMSAASFEVDFNDSKESGIPVTMLGNYDADAPTTFPATFEFIEA